MPKSQKLHGFYTIKTMSPGTIMAMSDNHNLFLLRKYPEIKDPVARIRAALKEFERMNALPANVEAAILDEIQRLELPHQLRHSVTFDLMRYAISPGRFAVATALLDRARDFGLDVLNRDQKESLLRRATQMRAPVPEKEGSNNQYAGQMDGEVLVQQLMGLGALDGQTILDSHTEDALLQAGFEKTIMEVLRTHTQLAFPHPEKVAAFAIKQNQWEMLERLLVKQPELLARMSTESVLLPGFKTEAARDMIDEFATHFVLPVMVHEMHVPPASIDARTRKALHVEATRIAGHMLAMPYEARVANSIAKQKTQPQAPLSEDERECIVREARRGFALTNTWEHPAISMPRSLLPDLAHREWEPLFEGSHTFKVGEKTFTIRALTDSDALLKESEALHHCVGKRTAFATKCCGGKTHILSISDAQGKAVSTVELECENYAPLKVKIKQHRGESNAPMKQTDAQKALNMLLKDLGDATPSNREHATLKFTKAKRYGETHDSKQRMQKGQIVGIMGYEPEWDGINAVMQEFKRTARAGSLPMPQGNLEHVPIAYLQKTPAVHDYPAVALDPQEGARWHARVKKWDATHVIDGEDPRSRNMNAQTWLYAPRTDFATGAPTSYMDMIHQAIGKVDKGTASKAKEKWTEDGQAHEALYNAPPPRAESAAARDATASRRTGHYFA